MFPRKADLSVSQKADLMLRGDRLDFLIDILKALKGDPQYIGQVFDHIFFRNKANVCTILSLLATSEFDP